MIAANLKLKIHATDARTHRAVHPEAYPLCLQGRQAAASLSEAGMARAVGLYTRALEIDPGFAEAFSDLAQIDVMQVSLNLFQGEVSAAFERAERHAREALCLAPHIGEPLAVLGDIALVRGRLAEAETEFERAIELCPDSEHLFTTYPFFLLRMGRPDRMAQAAERQRRTNPLSWTPADLNGGGLLYGGRPGEALACYERAEQLGSAPVSHAHHALALARLGRRAEAVARARVALDPAAKQGWAEGFLAHSDAHAAWALAEAGEVDEADALIRRLLAVPENWRFGAGMPLAVLGGLDEAFECLPRYPQKFVGFLLNLVHHCEPLRNDPRCEPMLRELGALEAFAAMGRVLRGDNLDGV